MDTKVFPVFLLLKEVVLHHDHVENLIPCLSPALSRILRGTSNSPHAQNSSLSELQEMAAKLKRVLDKDEFCA